jgi:50S ribosomal protein L16 3-hydroxylase
VRVEGCRYRVAVSVLASFLAPVDMDTFLDDHWPTRPLLSSPHPDRVALFAGIDALESPAAAFEGAARVHYFKPDGTTGTASPDGADVVYRMGLTCFLGCAHIPELMEIAEGLAADLGLPSGAVTAEVFCSDGASGAPLHSDHDANFATLLRGEKTWAIAENRHIRNQTALCRPVRQDEHDPRQLALADRLPFPEDLPEDATTLTVEAGGALFLPRGWWHRTSSGGTCFQVNLVVNGPMWLDVFVAALARQLEADADWREFAYDVLGSGDRRNAAENRFAALVAALGAQLNGDDALDVARQLLADSGLRPAKAK